MRAFNRPSFVLVTLLTLPAFALVDGAQPRMSPETVKTLIETNLAGKSEITLDQLIGFLPGDFRMNHTLKHGDNLKDGPRGHRPEVPGRVKPSQSASATAPRAILFDEATGFIASFNGGVDDSRLQQLNAIDAAKASGVKFGISKTQTSPHRLDMHRFDTASKRFVLEKVDFPVTNADGARPTTDKSCLECHGAGQRPIFSMYPDWPQFYGSDNDELVGYTDPARARQNEYQKEELDNLSQFKRNMAVHPDLHRRYLPLFDQANVNRYFGPLARQVKGRERLDTNFASWRSYPYRPFNTESPSVSVSRAFAFRPSLRLGIVLNRYMAVQATDILVKHPNFQRYGKFFLFNLLQCRWERGTADSRMNTWRDALRPVLAAVKDAHRDQHLERDGRVTDLQDISVEAAFTAGGNLNYRQLWAIFGLMARDIDIRLSYEHGAFNAHLDGDKNYAQVNGNVMDIGYIGSYFNSYFDGSATIDELVAAKLYQHYAAQAGSGIRAGIPLEGLLTKYQRFTDRLIFDRDYFTRMDRIGGWIPINYPASLSDVHHRDPFEPEFGQRHTSLCLQLEAQIRDGVK